MAYVPLVGHPNGIVPKVAAQYARRRFGRDVEPVSVASHRSGVLVAGGLLETAADKGWRKLDRHLNAEAATATGTATPVAVTDEFMDGLPSLFRVGEIELASWVALENHRFHFHAALGLHRAGFSDSCRVAETS